MGFEPMRPFSHGVSNPAPYQARQPRHTGLEALIHGLPSKQSALEGLKSSARGLCLHKVYLALTRHKTAVQSKVKT